MNALHVLFPCNVNSPGLCAHLGSELTLWTQISYLTQSKQNWNLIDKMDELLYFNGHDSSAFSFCIVLSHFLSFVGLIYQP